MGLTTYSPGIAQVEAPWALKDLPPYRPVARKLMRLTVRQDVQLDQIQRVLRMDAAFTADVLRLANSPLIGMRGEIKSVMQAVMMLGLERIKGLATTAVFAGVSHHVSAHQRSARLLEAQPGSGNLVRAIGPHSRHR